MSVNVTTPPTPLSPMSNWTQNLYAPELGSANALFPPGTAINQSSGAGVEAAAAADDEEYFYQVEQLTFLWVLFTLIVIGNSIVLITLSVSKAVIVKCLGRGSSQCELSLSL